MHKPHLLLMVLLMLILLLVAACNNAPETQVYIVVTATPSGEPPETEATDNATAQVAPIEVTPTPGLPVALPTTAALPTPFVTEIQVAEQVFEHGRMFWLQPNREIWVMINAPDSTTQGQWLIFEDTFEEGQPEYDPAIVPPGEGFAQPERGFGKLWREHPEIREALGWGTTPEFGFVTPYRYEAGGYLDSNGAYVSGPGIHVLTSLGNESFAFEEATMTWRRIN